LTAAVRYDYRSLCMFVQCMVYFFQHQRPVSSARHCVTAFDEADAWWQSRASEQTQPETSRSQPS